LIISGISAGGAFLLPESPKYLYEKGKYEDCRDVLRIIARVNN
jgi:hypothetical protein